MYYIFQGDDGIPGPPGPKGIRVSDTCCVSNAFLIKTERKGMKCMRQLKKTHIEMLKETCSL